MTDKKFLVSVADAYAYDSTGGLLFVGKTLLDSSIEVTLSNADVRAGRGNQLQYVYFHTAEMNIAITEAQWSLEFLSATVGQDIGTGANVYKEESVTLGSGGSGTITGTPLAVSGSTVYGWVTLADGTTEKVTFTGSNFDTVAGVIGEEVCVRFYAVDSAARELIIPANIVPKIVRLVLETQLASSDASSNIIGTVQIEVPKAQLTGAFSIAMKADGVSSTPVSARALAANNMIDGCSNVPTYATIKEIVSTANWWDNVIGLSIVGGDFTLPNGDTEQLVVRAIPSVGSSFPVTSGLTFSSSSAGVATVNSSGLVTWVSAGSTTVKASITAKTSIDANVVVTASA